MEQYQSTKPTEADRLIHAHRRRLARGLLFGLLTTILLVVVLELALVGLDALSAQGLASLATLAGITILALVRLSRGHQQQAVALTASSLLLLLGFEVLEAGIHGSSGLLVAFVIPITLTGLLLGRAALLAVTTFSALTVIAVHGLERANVPWVGFDPNPLEPGTQVILFTLIAALLALILDRFGGALRDAYEAALSSSRNLVGLNRRLREQIAQREQAIVARDRSESHLELASEVAGLGVWSWDLTTGEIVWSDSLRELLGLPRDTPASLEGFMARVHPDDRPHMRISTIAPLELPERVMEELRVVRPNGEVCWLESRYRALQDEHGARWCLTGVLYDVSAHKRLEQDLEQRVAQRTAELVQANAELEAFTYSASHDLHAPLRSITGFTEILLDEHATQLDETARGYLDRVHGAATRMAKIIDSLLGLARFSRAQLRPQKVDLSYLARSILADLRNAEPLRAVDAQVEEGVMAEGDPDLLRIVLENLLGNAWKFTRACAIARIEFGTTRLGEERAFFVRDNGAGFDMEHTSKLFEPFARLHTESEYEGTGIGLATVQRIVHRHGGRIEAEAAVDQGATFVFTLGPEQHNQP